MELPRLTKEQRKQIEGMLEMLRLIGSAIRDSDVPQGLCRLFMALYQKDPEKEELFVSLKKYYHWLYPGMEHKSIHDYWFPRGESKPRIDFLETVLQKDNQMRKDTAVNRMLVGSVLLLALGVLLTLMGAKSDMSENVSIGLMTAGVCCGGIGLLIYWVTKWVSNE